MPILCSQVHDFILLHFISLKYVYWVWSRIHLVRNFVTFKKDVPYSMNECRINEILMYNIRHFITVFWHGVSCMNGFSAIYNSSLMASCIVKCPLDAHFRISPEVVRHLYILFLLLYEYYDYGYTMAHILFFYYMEVGIFGHWLVLVSLKPTFPRKPNLFWLVSSLKHAGE